jgi:hypothetical protein
MGVLKALEKEKPSNIGLCQALAVSAYCALIALFFKFMSEAIPKPGFWGFFLMLVLFVFSAAVTGSLVFGYPAYLALVKNKVKEALNILAFTIGFFLAIILITVILLMAYLS